jgi:hypothetical protein
MDIDHTQHNPERFHNRKLLHQADERIVGTVGALRT